MGFKFSIRQMLLGMVAVAIVCALLGGWANGSAIAYGLTVAILGSAFAFVIFGAVYWIALQSSYLFRRNNQSPPSIDSGAVNTTEPEPTVEALGQ